MLSKYLHERFKAIFKEILNSPIKDSAYSKLHLLNNDITTNLRKLENFEWTLDRITFKALMKYIRKLDSETCNELKFFINDLLILNQLNLLLNDLSLDTYGSFLELLNELSDSNISSKIEYTIVSDHIPIILNEDESIEVIETLSIYHKLFKSIDAKNYLKIIIYNAASDKLLLTEQDARKVANRLLSLKETSLVDYDITKDYVDLYFQLLEINKRLNMNQIEWFPQVKLSDEDVFQSLFDLRNFRFSLEHKNLYEKWICELEQIVKSMKKNSLDEIKAYSYYVNRVIKDPEELSHIDIGDSLEIKNLNSIVFTTNKPIYVATKYQLYTKVYLATWGENQVAVKLFYCNNLIKLKSFLKNQALIMYLMSDDKNFLKLYGAFITKLPEELRDLKMQNNELDHGCLVMEYHSISLKAILESTEFNSKESITRQILSIKIGWKLIKSMKRLNDKGIKHKDLKPSNILIKKEGDKYKVKIIDFDVSTFKQKHKEFTVEATTQVVGTQKYMSPEVLLLFRSQTTKSRYNANRADVFSLGLVLLEIAVSGEFFKEYNIVLTNDLGAEGAMERLQAYIESIINTRVSNEELKELLLSMLTVDPYKRPAFRDLVKSNESHLDSTFKTFEDIREDDYQYIDL